VTRRAQGVDGGIRNDALHHEVVAVIGASYAAEFFAAHDIFQARWKNYPPG